jgi:hypothetical protein
MRYIIAIFFITSFYSLHAQVPVSNSSVSISLDLQPIALLDIEPDNSAISFIFGTPSQAGGSLTLPASNNTKYINFTSAVTPGSTRRIDAQINGSLPIGTKLRLQTTGPTYGGGNRGAVSNGDIYLTNGSQTIVNSIGGGQTDNGQRGYRLNYSLEIQNYSQLRAESGTVSITYTLSDN